MNAWQAARQLKALLAAATWPDSPTEPVFGKVLISVAPTERVTGQLRFPFALIVPTDASADDDQPTLETQNYSVRIVQRVASDAWGEAALIGGPRPGGQGSSRGRGIMELEEEVLRAAGALDAQNGIRLQLVWRSAVGAAEDAELGYVASREYQLSGWVSSLRDYPAPTRLAGTTPGGGSTVLSWTLPPSRYDRKALVLRRAAGATAPASATAGTGVTVGALVSTVTDSPGAAQFSYALFMGYDETGSGVADRHSAAETLTITVA